MNPDLILDLAREALTLALVVSLPVLVIVVLSALLSAVFQTVTGIQDASIGTTIRFVVACLALLAFGPWMFGELQAFAGLLMSALSQV